MARHLFTCHTCGSHNLVVEHTYTVAHGPHLTTIFEWGPLDDDHHWEYIDEEKPEEWDDWDILSDEDREAWQEWDGRGDAPTEPEVLEDSHEFYVRCEGCNREIPFGWSHPDRGGRIWPVECADFVPGRAWMEERYQ